MRAHFACHGGGEQPLKVNLRRLTESKAIEITPELLTPIIEASHDADERRQIMKHLRECLSEPSGKRWHRIYAGLLLIEKLTERGSHALVIELAHGHHFDLIQKVSLLEHFDSTARGVANPWAQDMVRKKAAELRASLAPRLQRASAEELPQDAGLFVRDTASTCSPGGLSTSTGSTTASSAASSTNSPFGAPLGNSPFGVPLTAGSPSFPVARAKRQHDIGGQNFVDNPEALANLTPRSRLQAELKRITESGIIDIPPEFFTFVVEASHDRDSQRVIMRHVRGCLAAPQKTRWQRIHACLLLVESVLQRGSPKMFAQASTFNLTRRIWLLQEFDHRADWRAQSLVRKRARALHDRLVQEADAEEVAHTAREHIGDAFSALRVWVEAGDLSAPSDSSSRPWSDASSADEVDRGPAGGDRAAGPRAVGGESSDEEDDGRAADKFFTPMQTPAPPRAVPRPSHLTTSQPHRAVPRPSHLLSL